MAARFPQGKQPEFSVHCTGTKKVICECPLCSWMIVVDVISMVVVEGMVVVVVIVV